MYERNAIVLERYFSELFHFKNSCNLRENYDCYRKLYECYGTLCDAIQKENFCQQEFENASQEVLRLQGAQEKLYNKSAKYEYSRYIIFSNIGEGSDNIEKHLSKVDADVQKNNEEIQKLGEQFVQAVQDYNQKQADLKEAIALKKSAQEAYDEIYEKAQNCYDEITDELLEETRQFIQSENKDIKKELQETFENNGKNEKNPFDPDVISNTISKSLEIYKAEMDIYLAGYDRISKLLEEIETDSVKTDKHMKYYKDSKAKLDFLNAEKDYLVQFLDNERMGAIYDKKTHRKLMLEACKKFVLDCAQIEKLYDIILKEAAGRSTKKIYKESYNKQYLIDLESSAIEPNLDTGKMRQQAIAFVNLNYWRMEGMKSVYSVFDDVVTSIYERDLSEFTPEELKEPEVELIEESTEEPLEETLESTEEIRVEEKVRPRKVYYSSKRTLANAIYCSLQKWGFDEFDETVEDVENVEETEAIEEQQTAILEEMQTAPIDVIEVRSHVEESSQDVVPEQEETLENVEVFENEKNKENVETFEDIDDEEEEEENIFDLSKLDEIEDEEPVIEKKTEKVKKIEKVEPIEKEEKIEKIEEPSKEENAIVEAEEEEEDAKDRTMILDTIQTTKETTKEIAKADDSEEEEEEDSILEIYFSEPNEDKEEADSKANQLGKKVGLFQKLVGLNSKKKKEA